MVVQDITAGALQSGKVQNTDKSQGKQTASKTGFAYQMQLAAGMGKDLDAIFDKASQTYGVPRDLLRSIAFHESGFQSGAVSSAGAMGIMQLMPATAKTMGVSNPFDAEENVMGGAKLLGQYMDQYDGDLKLVLAAYGAGSGAVAKYNGVPPYAETKKFVEDIMSVVDKNILTAEAPPQEPVYEEYPELWDQMSGFEEYTKRDYDVFIGYLLSMGTPILSASDEREKKEQNPYLFYLG